MTLDEKLSIASKVHIDKLPYIEIAKEHRISTSRVSSLISKFKKKPDLLDILI